ncbi:MAG: hypothetical protein LH649_16620 [Pseudanabaena sp. CAN_BIN31]|nr:hypothetical protein [Pseudanabaena sp. CAN_BIN31]
MSTTDGGQSFKSPQKVSGGLVNLDTWSFQFSDEIFAPTAPIAQAAQLNIYLGTGNGGSIVANGTSTSAILSTLTGASFDGGANSVTWSFTGLQLSDTATYTAVLVPRLTYRATNTNPYLDGSFTSGGSVSPAFDTVFQASFSTPTAVPFEFDPSFGVVAIGGLWLGNKAIKKFKANQTKP